MTATLKVPLIKRGTPTRKHLFSLKNILLDELGKGAFVNYIQGKLFIMFKQIKNIEGNFIIHIEYSFYVALKTYLPHPQYFFFDQVGMLKRKFT